MFLLQLKHFETKVADVTKNKQCAKCQGGGITDTGREALSEGDCFCLAGSMIVREPGKPQRCEPCSCKEGQYIDLQSGVQQCLTGRELSMPGVRSVVGLGHKRCLAS